MWLICLPVLIVVCVLLGAYVSTQKARSPLEGAILGCLLGPLGVLVAAVLPTQPDPGRKPSPVEAVDDDEIDPGRWDTGAMAGLPRIDL